MASPEPWLSISTNYHNCLLAQSEAHLPANDSQLACSFQPCSCNIQRMIPAVTPGAVTAKSSMQSLLALLNNADVPCGASVVTCFALVTHPVIQ